jgi:phenylalanyl-tRNA synthetase beta chain
MKFAVSWLEEWVKPNLSANELAHRMTMAGLEVDSVEAEGEGLGDVVIAEVSNVSRHPDADRLSVCAVSTGDGDTVDVVCGAPNVVAGMKTPLAVPGTRLPNGMKLRRSKIRGVVSNGMLCSAIEIGLGSESDGILELPADAPVGQPLAEYLGLPDTVIDVDITPNRGDCFCVLGIARDVAALTGQPMTGPVMHPVAAKTDCVHPVERPVPEACPRFAHRVVQNINSKARSPLWMTERLRKSGLRAIHPVVDVTNYVMLELGQPLHAYDMARLQGAVRPRYAEAGEKVTLLDEREITLNTDTVVISDDSGAIGMAGIMGGLSTMVTDDTRDVFFEAAFWPQQIMAGRARSYAMHTDASTRFERGVDPAGQARAVERAVELLVMIAGGDAGPLVDDYDEALLPERKSIHLTDRRLKQVLGLSIPAKRVTEILAALGLELEEGDGYWNVIPPSYRFDIAIEDDLVEEVARVFGYDRIPEATATANMPLGPVTETTVDVDVVANALVARDYQEVITYSFVDAESDRVVCGEKTDLVLSNPISSEMSVMRSSLWTGMLQVAAGNVARQQERVRIFEIGRTYHGTQTAPREVRRVGGVVLGPGVAEQWSVKSQGVDFYDLKADVEVLLAMSGAAGEFTFIGAEHPALQPGQSAEIRRGETAVGYIGKLHPTVARRFDLKANVFVFELDVEKTFAAEIPVASAVSKFPAIRRDIAVVVDDLVIGADLVESVRSAAPDLIRRVIIFDIYRGSGIEAGRKSVALGLILQETSRTLTDVDADTAIDAAIQKIKQEFDADLRD